MFRSKRKDSAIRTLVAETLVLAKTHGYVEKIEHELEEELQRENTEPSNKIFAKWRRRGENLLKNKYTLLTVALFCVTECALILGELILDLHKVKDVLEAQETASQDFVKELHNIYPQQIRSLDIDVTDVYKHILLSTIHWAENSYTANHSQPSLQNTYEVRTYNETRHRRSSDYTATVLVQSYDVNRSTHNNVTTSTTLVGSSIEGHHESSHGHSLEEEIAHAFHMASITILSILVFETILKALCAGTEFFQRKLETFDLCVVLISFVVDLVCMQIMPRYKIQDFVFILAFLLPWRVIRVVNSLVVAVQDHEHFRLKLIYGRKKKIVNSLRESEIKLQLFRAQCNALKRLCFNEGIDESKIDQILMVEECVVNKAGKSKCKIKIDNSSVILLNDKTDFPRLSPRPSLLNLADKLGGRRKSMLPTCFTGLDREQFLNSSRDTPKKGIFKMRARSNSESGRGTLSSPDEGPLHQNSLGDGGGISGLNTPIVVDRKNSLSSPGMASYVRNILNSLESKGGQMNGSCSRLGGHRESIDNESIAEEEERQLQKERAGRRFQSLDKTPELNGESNDNGATYHAKRRASLQPQKCVDEDDGTVNTLTVPVSSYIPRHISNKPNKSHPVIEITSSPLKSSGFLPTKILIDPPSNNSNHSLSSSASGGSNPHPPSDWSSSGHSTTSPATVMPSASNNRVATSNSTNVETHSISSVTPKNNVTDTLVIESETTASVPQEKIPATPVIANLKPKTLRTSSDIENENNLTQSESYDACDSKSNDDCTRNTSIEELDDEFDTADNIQHISNTDDAVLAGSSIQKSPPNGKSVGLNGQSCPQNILSKPSSSPVTCNATGNGTGVFKEGGSVDVRDQDTPTPPLDVDLKSGSLSHLLC